MRMLSITSSTSIITHDWPNRWQNMCKRGVFFPRRPTNYINNVCFARHVCQKSVSFNWTTSWATLAWKVSRYVQRKRPLNCTQLLWYLSLVTQFPMNIKIRWDRRAPLFPLICVYYHICLCSKIIFA